MQSIEHSSSDDAAEVKRPRAIAEDESDAPDDVNLSPSIRSLKRAKYLRFNRKPTIQDDFCTLREKRRKRDEEEQYIGLKKFEGSQRGWDGRRESERQRVLKSRYDKKSKPKPRSSAKKYAASPSKLSRRSGGTGPATADLLVEDIHTFRAQEEVRKIAVEECADGLTKNVRDEMMKTSWDYDFVARGGLRRKSPHGTESIEGE